MLTLRDEATEGYDQVGMQKIPLRRNTGNAPLERWLRWANTLPTDVPCLWLHAASVGEALAAEPIVRRLKARYGGLRVAHTHTSKSVSHWRGKLVADRSDFLPGFRRTSCAPLFAALRPRLLLLSRGDLWPGMLAEAHARGVPTVVTGAQISRSSLRRKRPFRYVFSRVCRTIRWVGAVSDDDAAAWHNLGVPDEVIQVTGDPRDDFLIERTPDWASMAALRRTFDNAPCVVAGSLEKADEGAVLTGFANVHRRYPESRLIVVPHNPSPSTLARLERGAKQLQLPAARWPDAAPSASAVTLVTVVGWLADLYALATIAYVGGGMRATGRIHSVAEPAVYGVPTLVGPGVHRSQEAHRFMANEALIVLEKDVAPSFSQHTIRMFENPTEACARGLRARGVLAAGASQTSASRIREILEETNPGRERSRLRT